jgi:hypothetical protein
MESCNQGLGIGTFDFSKYEEVVKVNPEDSVSFIPHWAATLELKMEPSYIQHLNFKADKASTTIYVRVKNQYCFSITSFQLIKKLSPTIHNFIPIMTIAMTALHKGLMFS